MRHPVVEELSALGLAVTPKVDLKKGLANSIVHHLRPQLGSDVYQSTEFSVQHFPRSYAQELFSSEVKMGGTYTWTFETLASLISHVEPIMKASTSGCAGISKAFLKPSERVVRVIATVLPGMVVKSTVREGVEVLMVYFTYMLSTEMGEVHWPKDPERRELAIGAELEQAMRQHVLLDAENLGETMPLSPAWWRQLHLEARAVEMKDMLRGGVASPAPKRARPAEVKWVVTSILEASKTTGKAKVWYKVLWAGYDPSWEIYRIEGEVGSPICTWEPHSSMANTEALATFLSLQQ